MEKLIITVAATGNVPTKEMNPHLPVTPAEIAETAVRCRKAGASLIHIHARDAAGAPTLDAQVFAQIHRLIEQRTDLIVQISTGGRAGMDPEAALRGTNEKFVRRFKSIEAALAKSGRTPAEATLDEMEALWQAAKASE